MMIRTIALACALTLATTPAVAKERDKSTTSDPNRVICRTANITGSRLQTRRTCLSAIQWLQLEREQRETVDRVQAFKPLNDTQ